MWKGVGVEGTTTTTQKMSNDLITLFYYYYLKKMLCISGIFYTFLVRFLVVVAWN